MADKKFDQDFTELTAPDSSSRLMISKLDNAIRKTYWITWDKFTGPSITSAAFTGDDLVFTKDDSTTVTLLGAKTSLKGPAGANGTNGTNGADGADGADGVGIASVTSNKVGKTTTVTVTKTDATTSAFNILDGADGIGSGDMLKATYDPTNKQADAFSMDNMVETATKKILTSTERTNLGNQSGTNTGDETDSTIKTKLGITTLSGSNTGDQTSIVGITGTIAQFNTALSDGDFATGGGTATGTNTGDETQSTIITKIGYTPENAANKENSTIDTSTTKYPTVNLLKTGLDAKTPTSRTITINGTAYDLSSDRSWTVTAGSPGNDMFALAGTIGTTGTNVANTILSNGTKTISSIDMRFGTAGNGTTTIDINKNGTTIFSANPSITTTNQYTIAGGTLSVTSLASGDKLTLDIDAVASTTKGIDLYVRVNYS